MSKKRVLITGGSGTVGSAFIKHYSDVYDFGCYSRNDSNLHNLQSKFPNVECFLGSVENKCALLGAYDKFVPHIVVHAAAIKHIDFAEKNAFATASVNILGSMNVIECSRMCCTPVTVAISTDKACEYRNVYGISKYLMERCFLESDISENSFSVCRFGNVAHSSGSVIPFWKNAAQKGEPLKVTNVEMNRLMFSQRDAADLVYNCIKWTETNGGGFILSKLMKSVNILNLAKMISDNIEIVGPRPGEKINENLISANELPFTQIIGDYVKINKEENPVFKTRLGFAYDTLTAPFMDNDEIKTLIDSN